VCFTSFETDYQLLPQLWPRCVFAVWQMELAPETLSPHYQGYMELDAQVAFSTLHEWEGLAKAHFEKRRGNQRQAIAYCKKEDTRMEGPYEWGTPKAQGQRSDLLELQTDLDKGLSLVQIAQQHFPEFVKYPTAIRMYRNLRCVHRDWPMEIYIIVGPSGTGKTRFVLDSFPDAYWKPHGKWWDRYDGQDVVVVDEMYGHRFSFTELLNLMDRYPHSVECKG